ncbi:Four helix bundle sensory module for signal transduction [Psychroflexus salarius]|uniref:Four helix bundle sensory module for signal transduction n=1 Tax=Psychroflexus salarius TaxID=1155689 RepID=A0A1M4WQT9_9FLAO|nr:MCP four helix bundle domain-containing protein [Psychroflexus salarius]SHE83550.1 Four helix bundle sensory module for signal transduction [Psychroflexus salarius]
MKLTKLKWAGALLFMMLVIIATNFVDRHNFEKVQDSINSIYKDRLVVNDIIFEINLLLQEKELAILEQDEAFYGRRNKEINTEINQLLEDFKATKLVPVEATTLNDLEQNLDQLYRLENKLGQAPQPYKELQIKINTLETNLHSLAKIQLEEGRRQLFIGKKAIASVDLYTKMEVYILIFLALLLLVTLFYRPKKTKTTN